KGPPWSLVFAADAKTLISGGWQDATVLLWDLTSGKERTRVEAKGGLAVEALSPDGKTLATGGANGPHAVVLWDAATGKESDPFPGNTSPVSAAAFSPDGKLAVTGGGLRGDPVARLWDAATAKPAGTFRHPGG